MRIHANNNVAATCADSLIQTRRYNLAFIDNSADLRVSAGIVRNDSGCAIGAHAVRDQVLAVETRCLLTEKRIENILDVRSLIAAGHYYGNLDHYLGNMR
jgi:hypothetical protein